MLAVIKADAYGHGLLPAARTLAEAGVDYLGVGSLEEGLAAPGRAGLAGALASGDPPGGGREGSGRRSGGGSVPPGCSTGVAAAALTQGKKARVHLKVDTGMGRLGLLPEEVLPFLESLKKHPQLEVMGLISHLAVAEKEDKSYTQSS